VVGTVCIGAFIGQVDASIVQLAMPAFEDAFDAPAHAVSWVALGYVLAFGATLPLFSRLSQIGGHKALYLAWFAVFALFSALCGLAPNLPLPILFRILQGVGGGVLEANALTILVAASGISGARSTRAAHSASCRRLWRPPRRRLCRPSSSTPSRLCWWPRSPRIALMIAKADQPAAALKERQAAVRELLDRILPPARRPESVLSAPSWAPSWVKPFSQPSSALASSREARSGSPTASEPARLQA
jgi:hypothetical protein